MNIGQAALHFFLSPGEISFVTPFELLSLVKRELPL